MPGVPMPSPHYHSRCIQGDLDHTFFHREYAEQSAAEENSYLQLKGMSPEHREEVIECSEECGSSGTDIHRKRTS